MNKYKMEAIIMRNSFNADKKHFENFMKNFEVHSEVEERILTVTEMKNMGFGKKG